MSGTGQNSTAVVVAEILDFLLCDRYRMENYLLS